MLTRSGGAGRVKLQHGVVSPRGGSGQMEAQVACKEKGWQHMRGDTQGRMQKGDGYSGRANKSAEGLGESSFLTIASLTYLHKSNEASTD